MARKPGIRQVPEKEGQEDGRVRLTRGEKKGKSKVTVRMRGTEGSKTEKGGKNGKKSLEWI